jgi:hypothetical protein
MPWIGTGGSPPRTTPSGATSADPRAGPTVSDADEPGRGRPLLSRRGTLAADVSVPALGPVDGSAGCSIKDSFACLDLSAFGFHVLPEASGWSGHRRSRYAGQPGVADTVWEVMRESEVFVFWKGRGEATTDLSVLRADLLGHPGDGLMVATAIVSAGAVLNRSAGTVGIRMSPAERAGGLGRLPRARRRGVPRRRSWATRRAGARRGADQWVPHRRPRAPGRSTPKWTGSAGSSPSPAASTRRRPSRSTGRPGHGAGSEDLRCAKHLVVGRPRASDLLELPSTADAVDLTSTSIWRTATWS